MLEILSDGFKRAKGAISGATTLTESNIQEAVREIRVSLLEADVELGVVKAFLERVKSRAIGELVQTEVKHKGKKVQRSPGEHFVSICHNELEKLMGTVEEVPIIYRRPFTTIMLVGLQGTGKTTTAAKLAKYLLNEKRKPLLVAADIYRPAAVEQLQTLGAQLNVPVFHQPDLSPPQLCADALREAKKRKRDVIIFDTAGRLAIDDALMGELEEIKERTNPTNTFLVCDAMAGQDTVKSASEFNRRIDISGFILTKIDGDARGGAALSIREITKKPVKFLGVGEGVEALEPFRPEGLASRILGMGDVVGLMRDFENIVDEKEAERDTKKLLKGKFTLDDFLRQLKSVKQLGSMGDILEKFPIFGDQGPPDGVKVDDNAFNVMESMIQSMTPKERQEPKIIDESRAKRIARGSGRKKDQVHDLVQRFEMMRGMMANFAMPSGMLGKMPGMKQLNQLKQLKGGNINDMLGGMGNMAPAGSPGLPGMPGMPDMPDMGDMPDMSMQHMMSQLGLGGQAGPAAATPKRSAKDTQKQKSKRKAQRKARKKGRKR